MLLNLEKVLVWGLQGEQAGQNGRKKKLDSSYDMELVRCPELEQRDWFECDTNSW